MQLIILQHQEPSALLKLSAPYPWLPDCYMMPTIADDPLLQLDFEPGTDIKSNSHETEGGEEKKEEVDDFTKYV